MPWKVQSGGGKISPVILLIIVILAVVFFISGILHLLVRFLMKRRASSSSSSNSHQSNNNSRYPHDLSISGGGAFQRQLQQLFHLHDSGLDQAFIDALPVFLYQDLMGLKEPFDCAVCLCEFSGQDKLRLLPLCTHAFHLHCIDTWLLSNSTCPLCRGCLFTPGFSIENPIFEFDDYSRDEDPISGNLNISVPKPVETNSIVNSKRVFSVRLGKFRNTNDGGRVSDIEVGETSKSNLDARRCYSMGSYQYVVDNTDLQVSSLQPGKTKDHHGLDLKHIKGRCGGLNGNSSSNDGGGDAAADGKNLNSRSKGESFSVSKVWLWSNKDKFSSSFSENQISSSVNNNVSLPWTPTTQITTTSR